MKCSRSPPRIPFCHGHAPLCWHAKRGLRYAAPLSVRTTLPIRASFPVRHPSPSGILSRQAPSLSGTHPCQAPSLSGILSRQALIPARHPSLSGILLRQASFPVRHSSLSGILPFQSMDHIHHKLVAWHRYAYLCRGTDNRTADGIHLALPAVP